MTTNKQTRKEVMKDVLLEFFLVSEGDNILDAEDCSILSDALDQRLGKWEKDASISTN